jgi:hypothetical protein
MKVLKTEYKNPRNLIGIQLCSGKGLACGGNAKVL